LNPKAPPTKLIKRITPAPKANIIEDELLKKRSFEANKET